MDFNALDFLKNLQSLKGNADVMQEELANVIATGTSGGNIVRVTLNGKMEMLSLELDPIVVDPRDIPMLQDLIVAAYTDAQNKIQDEIKSHIAPALNALNMFMPGSNSGGEQ
ncbi:MAG: YbaB/EbfC family nucleoid-associated protein [Treponemataceae bacterium]|nr:MAG: YbaB/EbfC family nucleoid-associated protein [Treponemataceae bacterium]